MLALQVDNPITDEIPLGSDETTQLEAPVASDETNGVGIPTAPCSPESDTSASFSSYFSQLSQASLAFLWGYLLLIQRDTGYHYKYNIKISVSHGCQRLD